MPTQITAVFEGGGVKGIGLVGALARLERVPDIQIVGYAGTSAGSIVAALAAAGYPAHDPTGKERDIRSILMETDFAQFLDGSKFNPFNLWFKHGLHPGDELRRWMYELLAAKGIRTFEDLQQRTGDTSGEAAPPRLRVIASDLTLKTEMVFDHRGYAKTQIADAVRMSAGIPLLFTPKRLASSVVVDGGLLSNYPLWAFGEWKHPTIGFKLVAPEEFETPEPPTSWKGFMTSLVATVLDAHDKKDERRVGAKSTIHIPTGDVGTTDFELARDKKEELYAAGEDAAEIFLQSSLEDLLNASVGNEFAAVPLMREKSAEWTETSLKVESLRRIVTIDRPDAVVKTEEEGVVTAEQVTEISRGMVGDSVAVWPSLDFEATLHHDGKAHPTFAKPQLSSGGKAATVRISFKGLVLQKGDRFKIEYAYRWAHIVPADEEYWAFGLDYYPSGVDRFVAEVRFLREPPSDHRFFELHPTMKPISIAGPEADASGAVPIYRYRAAIEQPKDLYLLSWRYAAATRP